MNNMCIYFYLKYWSPVVLGILTLITIIAVPIYLHHHQKSLMLKLERHRRAWELHQSKVKIFQILMAYRKNDKHYPEFLQALNVVDVVFRKHQLVVKSFRYYRDICMIPSSLSHEREQGFVAMMAEIATVLSIQGLKLSDIQECLSSVDVSDDPSIRTKNDKAV